MARPHGLQMAPAGTTGHVGGGAGRAMQVELGELRRVKEGVPGSGRKRHVLSTPAPDAGGRGRQPRAPATTATRAMPGEGAAGAVLPLPQVASAQFPDPDTGASTARTT